MSENIIAALIAGSVSLIVSLVSAFTIRHQIKSDRKKFESGRKHSFSQQLYEQRVRLYPEGYAITSKIVRKRKPEFLPKVEILQGLQHELIRWVEGEAGLFLSRMSLKAYWDLRNALSKNPAYPDSWAEEQAEKLWQARTVFRRQLRTDLGNLYNEDLPDSGIKKYWETL